jgi:PST family polysaccharide transporter
MQQPEARLTPPPTATARSSRLILGTQALRLIVRVGGTMALARLLTPDDYGVFGMAATVHGLAYVFQDFGLATVTIRKPQLTEDERTSLFWLNLILGAGLWAAVSAASFLAALFFREPALRVLLPVLGVSFLINGLHTQLRSQMVRDHRFTDLNQVEIGAFTVSTLFAIGVAWLGGGAWAPVSMVVVAEAAVAVGVWSKQAWRPGKFSGVSDALALMPAGISLSGNDVLRYLQRNADSLLVGRWLGAGALGIYGRAVQISSLPVIYLADPLMYLSISTLRHLSESAKDARIFWMRMLTDLSWVMIPTAVIFALLRRDLISVLLGAHWTSGAGVLRGLSIGIAALPLQMVCSWMFIAVGPTRRLLVASSISAAAVCVAAIAARNTGIAGVAYAVGLANLFSGAAALAMLRKSDFVTARDALCAFARPLAGSAVLAVSLALTLRGIGGTAPVRLAAGVAVSAVWLAVVWLAWPKAREELKEHFLWKSR